MAKYGDCEHVLRISRKTGIGVCSRCGDQFVHIEAVQQVEQESDRMIDMLAGVLSSVVWDLHEKAFEKHGVPHPESDPTAEAICEEKGHDRGDDGTCKRCGDSPFLGGGE